MRKVKSDFMFHYLFDTRFGKASLLWTLSKNKPKISKILLSSPQLPSRVAANQHCANLKISSCQEIDLIADGIASFLSGNKIKFSLDLLNLDSCSEFQLKTARAARSIPIGKVSSYSKIAEQAGRPGAARAAGMAMAANSFPIIIPCHRVVRSDGSLGGFGYGLKMKRELLKMEGVKFRDKEHVAEVSVY